MGVNLAPRIFDAKAADFDTSALIAQAASVDAPAKSLLLKKHLQHKSFQILRKSLKKTISLMLLKQLKMLSLNK
ncbi:MAG: hypothetical protein ACLUSV_11000 [Streptococcus sp.]